LNEIGKSKASPFAKNMMKKTAMAALVLAVLGLTSVAHATTTTSTTFQTPVHVQTSMTTSGCNNSPDHK